MDFLVNLFIDDILFAIIIILAMIQIQQHLKSVQADPISK